MNIYSFHKFCFSRKLSLIQLSLGFIIIAIIKLRCVPFTPTFSRTFIMKPCWILPKICLLLLTSSCDFVFKYFLWSILWLDLRCTSLAFPGGIQLDYAEWCSWCVLVFGLIVLYWGSSCIYVHHRYWFIRLFLLHLYLIWLWK